MDGKLATVSVLFLRFLEFKELALKMVPVFLSGSSRLSRFQLYVFEAAKSEKLAG